MEPSPKPRTPKARTEFDWRVYSDATFAGLAVLIPIPLVDWVIEVFFCRRIPWSVAARHSRRIDGRLLRRLSSPAWSWKTCLFLPFVIVIELVKRTYRTVLYFLTIKSASDKLAYYWHRAFLMQHCLLRGDLDDFERAPQTLVAFDTALGEASTSPVNKMSSRVVSQVHHALRGIVRWVRRHEEDEEVRAARKEMEEHWLDLSGSFERLARRYEELLVSDNAAVGDPSSTSVGADSAGRDHGS